MAIDPMTIAAGVSALGSIAGGIFGNSAGDEAAKVQKKALKLYKRYADQARGDVTPYLNMGKTAVDPLLDALGLGDSNAAISRFEGSPLYRLLYGDALNDARDDVTAYTSSKGMLNSGETFRGLADARAKTARSFFGDYVAGLGDVATRGQNAANTTANIATGAGSTLAGLQSGLGDIALAQGMGTANAVSGGLGDLASILGQKRGQSLYSSPGSYSGGPSFKYLNPNTGTFGGGT